MHKLHYSTQHTYTTYTHNIPHIINSQHKSQNKSQHTYTTFIHNITYTSYIHSTQHTYTTYIHNIHTKHTYTTYMYTRGGKKIKKFDFELAYKLPHSPGPPGSKKKRSTLNAHGKCCLWKPYFRPKIGSKYK